MGHQARQYGFIYHPGSRTTSKMLEHGSGRSTSIDLTTYEEIAIGEWSGTGAAPPLAGRLQIVNASTSQPLSSVAQGEQFKWKFTPVNRSQGFVSLAVRFNAFDSNDDIQVFDDDGLSNFQGGVFTSATTSITPIGEVNEDLTVEAYVWLYPDTNIKIPFSFMEFVVTP